MLSLFFLSIMIERISDNNIQRASEAFSASWRFSHNGIVSEVELDAHSPECMKAVIRAEERKGNVVFSYDKKGESRGIVSFHPTKNHISKLYVNPAYLRRGIGKELVSFAVSQMQTDAPVNVYCLNVNRRARAFYESVGFIYRGENLPFSDDEKLFLMVYVYERKGIR